MNYSKLSLKMVALTAAVFAASCAEQAIKKLETAPRNDYQFNNALANEYEALAKKESYIYNDAVAARHFARKGLWALHGKKIMPEDLHRWDIHEDYHQMLHEGRNRLLFALERGGRFVEPELGAKTQVAYDCLVEELEEGKTLHQHQAREISGCHALFVNRLSSLETAVFNHGPVRRVHFDYNSSVIKRDGMMTIAEVAARIRTLGDRKIMIIGRTDPHGNAKINWSLSQRRAMAVKKALMAHGISESQIVLASGRGELKTSRRQYEPNNRVTDIYFM